jgi:hypothetical protein
MDAADCVSWAQTVKAYWGGLVRANRTMKNAISALTTLSDCEAFDVTTGWPVN